MLLSLPDDVLIDILTLLSPKDLERFRWVCRHVHTLVEDSSRLQYILELGRSGYIEPINPRLDLSYGQKTSLLMEHRLRGGSPECVLSMEISPHHLVAGAELLVLRKKKLYKGIYVESYISSTTRMIGRLRFHRLPSWNRGTELKRWDHDIFCVNARNFALEPDLNLLVVIEAQMTAHEGLADRLVFSIHLRTLDSNDVHPGATLPMLSWTSNQEDRSDYPNWRLECKIIGNLLAVHSRHSRHAASKLVVWDWVLGSKLLQIKGEHCVGSFTIINKELIVIFRQLGKGNLSLGCLDVYQLCGSEDTHSARLASPLMTLLLPSLGEPYRTCRSKFSANPVSPPCAGYIGASWYKPDPRIYDVGASADHLCLIKLLIAIESKFIEGALFVPSSTIYEAVKRHIRSEPSSITTISWELWGQRTCWTGGSFSRELWADHQFSSGLRTTAGTRLGGRIRIWDFSSNAVYLARKAAESMNETAPAVVYPRNVGAGYDNIQQRSLNIVRNAFFGDGSLANQPYCVIEFADHMTVWGMVEDEHILVFALSNTVTVFYL